MYHISKSLDIEQFARDFARDQVVQVPGFLEGDSADSLYELLRHQGEWNLAFNKLGQHVDLSYQDYCGWNSEQKSKLSEIIWAQAEEEFQYFYKSIPVFDIYRKNLLPGNALNLIYELVNSAQFLRLMRKLVGDESIAYADVQATCFESGHFLKEHDDDVQGKKRVAAYVLNLTPGWRADWGGIFHIFNERNIIAQSVVPAFNVLNVFKVPRKHSVSYITPFAGAGRYSITGWVRRD